MEPHKVQLLGLANVLGSSIPNENLSTGLAKTLDQKIQGMEEITNWKITNAASKQKSRSFAAYCEDLMKAAGIKTPAHFVAKKYDLVLNSWGEYKNQYLTGDYLLALQQDRDNKIQGKSRYQWWTELVSKIDKIIMDLGAVNAQNILLEKKAPTQ